MFKQSIIIILIVLALILAYFGAYLPFARGRAYVTALRAVQSIHSLGEFETLFDRPLNFYSPVGDEEVAKFLGMDILNTITRVQPEELNRALVEYIEPYMLKNNVRHLIILGQMYSVLWREYGHKEDYVKSEVYQRKALEIGPNLPPVLYGLLDIYQASGDDTKLKEIASKIVKYWPEDEGVQNVLRRINAINP